ncbi:MAG: hypothetical protein WCS73_10565 [Lentisphaeria bacterium]
MKPFFYVFLFLLFLGTSCRTVLPPVSPVANLYPVVEHPAVLNHSEPFVVTEKKIQNILRESGLYEYLEKANMPPFELSIVCRALKHRGYAELDARRSNSPLHWISFRSMNGKTMVICAEFSFEHPGIIINGKKIIFKKQINKDYYFKNKKMQIKHELKIHNGIQYPCWKICIQEKNCPEL